MPKISVLMPVYNVAQFVEAAVSSILAQTMDDFELLIMDDGSTDDTLARVEALAATDPRVRFFARPNRKVAACLNEMVALARGDLIARMDGDDIARPDRLAMQYAYLQAHPDTAVVGSWVKTFGDRNETWHFRRWDNYSRNLLFFGVTILSHPTWMLKKSLLQKYPYNDAYRTIIDREWLARVAVEEPKLKFVALPQVLLDYRIHDGSVTGQFLDRQTELTRPVIDYYLRQHGVPLNEHELSLFLLCCFCRHTDAETLRAVGEVVTRVRDTVGRVINDEFFVFREKWLQFCERNGAWDDVNRYVSDDDVVFFREKRQVNEKEKHEV